MSKTLGTDIRSLVASIFSGPKSLSKEPTIVGMGFQGP